MMKKFHTVLIALVLTGCISAQAQFKFGMKAGLSLPNLEEQNMGVDFEVNPGWHAGLAFEYKLSLIGIQADALYAQAGANNIDGFVGGLDYSTIDIPVVAKLYIAHFFNIQVGTQFTFLLNADIGDIGIKDQMELKNVGFVAGLGVDFGSFMFSGRYLFPSSTIIADVGSYKSSSFQFAIGY